MNQNDQINLLLNHKVIDGILVDFVGDLQDDELGAYVQRGLRKYGKNLRSIQCVPDGDEIELTYQLRAQKFQRLRRITGYLVGDMSRWNNGKRAEEHDRVKHGVEAPHPECEEPPQQKGADGQDA